jgi:hypothetical protein
MSYTDFVRRLGTNEASDECYTPSHEVSPLLEYLDKDKTYYEATSGVSSKLIEGFTQSGYSMKGSDGKDFFECTTEDVYDGVITNPPYSKKDKFLEHCFDLGKPFALLLPVAAFQGQKRGGMFMKHGMSALVYNRRIDFTGKGSPTFGVAWFIHGFMPPNQIHWVDN